jgi:hypothetical protein
VGSPCPAAESPRRGIRTPPLAWWDPKPLSQRVARPEVRTHGGEEWDPPVPAAADVPTRSALLARPLPSWGVVDLRC